MFRNAFCLFLVQFLFWFFLLYDTDLFGKLNLFYGLVCCIFVTYISCRTGIVTKNSSFLFLQLGFYQFLGAIFFNFIRQSFMIAIAFWRANEEEFDLQPRVMRLDGNKEDAEVSMFINMLNLIPGIACVAVNVDKLVYYKLSDRYFSNRDIELMEVSVSRVNDEKLV